MISHALGVQWLFKKNFILFFDFTILYLFCHISSWICHRYAHVPHPEPSSLLPPRIIPLGRPSAPAPGVIPGSVEGELSLPGFHIWCSWLYLLISHGSPFICNWVAHFAQKEPFLSNYCHIFNTETKCLPPRWSCGTQSPQTKSWRWEWLLLWERGPFPRMFPPLAEAPPQSPTWHRWTPVLGQTTRGRCGAQSSQYTHILEILQLVRREFLVRIRILGQSARLFIQ